MTDVLPMVQVSLATDSDVVFLRLVAVLRSVDAQIMRAFESTTPDRAGSGIEEYTIIVGGLSVEVVRMVCSGFVNRFRLALVKVDGELIPGPHVIM